MRIGKHEYKGIEVWYDDLYEVWICELERKRDPNVERVKLGDLRKVIDSFIRREKKFKSFTVIELGSHWSGGDVGGIVTVTSIDADGEYWTKNAKGKRAKQPLTRLAKDTPENRREVVAQLEVIKQSGEAKEAAHDAIQVLAIEKEDE